MAPAVTQVLLAHAVNLLGGPRLASASEQPLDDGKLGCAFLPCILPRALRRRIRRCLPPLCRRDAGPASAQPFHIGLRHVLHRKRIRLTGLLMRATDFTSLVQDTGWAPPALTDHRPGRGTGGQHGTERRLRITSRGPPQTA